jgi:ABC-type siderophore export system fused ATPase/permease subunit
MGQLREILNMEAAGDGPFDVNALQRLAIFLLLAGVIGLYLRFVYNRCSRSLSDTDSTARVFPLLTIVTAAVIAVVKSSLALSLGLVGALSIVRFRAAIKEPEELVYLFLSIALGLCLGTEQLWLALLLVAVVTVFAVVMRYATIEKRSGRLLLTLTASAEQFEDLAGSLLPQLESSIANVVIQRFDLQEDEGQLRVVLGKADAAQEKSLLTTLQRDLPGYQISLVNLDVL